ncbi:hypothetical protein H671_3g9243 [Cricetulus griseus]|uniref:Uncharacterized protein n=1 Tax=Cricetulus griseus TaxID=10029 RepID=A0A061IE85_CRIGR|nr:hypothetical protein H671_3g9243 [Cricetulus griseus]
MSVAGLKKQFHKASQKAFIFPLLLKDFCCGWMTCGGNSSFSALGTVMALSSGFRDVKEAGGHQLRLHFAFPLNPNITTLIKSTTEYSTQQASASHMFHHQTRKLLV